MSMHKNATSNELIFARQIITCKDGRLILQRTNLTKILNYISSQYPKTLDIPIAIMAVLGPPKSGKSFMTNLLLHALTNLTHGGWMETLVKEECEFLSGFHFGSISSSGRLVENTSKYSGIWLWPTPYILNKCNGEEVAIYVLHHQIHEFSNSEEDIKVLEMVLGLICSRILEINNDQPEFRLGKIKRNLKDSTGAVCDSVVMFLNTNDSASRKVYRGTQDVSKLLSSYAGVFDLSLLDNFIYLNLIHRKQSDNLHDGDGRFNQTVLHSQLNSFKITINTVLDEDEVEPKKLENGNVFVISHMHDFLSSCISFVNKHSALSIDDFSMGESGESDIEENILDNDGKIFASSGPGPVDEIPSAVSNVFQVESNDGEDSEITGLKNQLDGMELSECERKEVIADDYSSDKNCRSAECERDEEENEHSDNLEARPDKDQSDDAGKSSLTRDIDPRCPSPLEHLEPTGMSNLEDIASQTEKSLKAAVPHENIQLPEIMPKCDSQSPTPMEIDEDELENSDRLEEESVSKSGTEVPNSTSPQVEHTVVMTREAELLAEVENNFQDLIHAAVSQVRQTLPIYVFQWVESSLTSDNETDFVSIYWLCFKEVLSSNYSSVVPVHLFKSFQRKVHKLNKDLLNNFSPIFKAANQLNVVLKKKFETFGYFKPEAFNKIALDAANDVVANTSYVEDSSPFMRSAVEKILGNFVEINNQILNVETGVMKMVAGSMISFYNDEMKRYLNENGPFTQADYRDMHTAFSSQLLNTSKEVLNVAPGELSEPAKTFSKDIETQLEKEFLQHKTANEGMLKKLQLETKKLLSTGYNAYVVNIEGVLQKHSDGYDPKLLEMEHNIFWNEQVESLKIQIRNKVRKTEPTDGHCEALMYQISQYWSNVQKVNSRNIEKGKNVEATSTLSGINDAVAGQPEEVVRDHGPLIVKLSYSYIAIGTKIGGKFYIIKNYLGEERTPILVGITGRGDLVYGTEAVTQCFNPDTGLPHWWITDYLGTYRSTFLRQSNTFNVGKERFSFDVSVEFLLGYLLLALKSGAEEKLKTFFSSAIITVPFWTCSSHRIQVKDAAKIAGFAEVSLVNEESAAALECATRIVAPLVNVLVLSINNNLASAIKYSYSKSKNLTMDSFEVQHCQLNEQSELKRAIQSFGKGSASTDFDSKAATVRKVCSGMLQKCLDPTYHGLMFLCDSANDDNANWIQAVQAVFKSSDPIHYSNLSECSNWVGMSGLSRISNLSTICNIVQDSVFHDIRKSFIGMAGVEYTSSAILNEYLRGREEKPVSFEVELPKREVCFYQKNALDKNRVSIGKIELQSLSVARQIYAILNVDSEAVVTLQGVRGRSGFRDQFEDVDIKGWKWITPNRNRDDKELMMNLIFELVKSEEKRNAHPETFQTISKEEGQAKARLKTICDEMQKGEQLGLYNFKSEISLALFLKKIQKARKLLDESNISEDNIAKEIAMLGSLRLKYSK